MRRGLVAFVSALVALGAAALASGASAATLVGDYQFQGTRASSGPGPALTDIASGNVFQSDTVMGAQRQVLTFPQGSGLEMGPAGVGASGGDYSEVVTFRFDTASLTGYARILDSSDGSDDTGLYTYGGMLDFYTSGDGMDHFSASPLLADNTYATVAMVVRGGTPDTRGFVNGAFVVDVPVQYDVISDTLRFFKDESTEDSAGAVSCIRVYSGALSDPEVAAIGASPTCSAPSSPAPPATKKKCKKHKKKHRAADAAKKKKCKKHKKHRR